MNTKIIAIVVVASAIFLFGMASVSASNAVWCKDASTGNTYCGYSSSSPVYCYVDASGGWADPPTTPCSWGGAGWRFSSNAYVTGKTCTGCSAVGSNWAEAYASSNNCYCNAG